MLVKLQRAAELTGKSRSTIHRAMEKGRVSFSTDENDERVIDVAELERVFGLLPPDGVSSGAADDTDENDLMMTELRLKLDHERERNRMLEDRVDELREERDAWRAQASGLLTDQRSKEQPTSFWRRLFPVAT